MKFKIIPNEQTPFVTIGHSSEYFMQNKESYKLLIKFLSFASRQFNCAGLAANQVSCNGLRIMEIFFAIKVGRVWDLVICPEIIIYHGKPKIEEEGCLTWLGKTIIAERYSSISVKYYNLKGEFITRKIDGFEAQIWQHEYNHLMGIAEVIK